MEEKVNKKHSKLKIILILMVLSILIILYAINLPFFVYWHYKNKILDYTINNNYLKAEQMIKKPLFICKKFFGENNKYSILLTQDLGDIYLRHGDYDKAKILLEKTYNLRKINSCLNSVEGIQLLNNLADLYHQEGNDQKAENIFRQTLVINNKIYGPNSEDVLASLLNIAQICIYQNHLRDAKEMIETIKLMPKNKINSQSQFYYGIIHVTGKYYQAKKYYAKAEKILIEATNDRNIPERYSSKYKANILNDLGELYQAQNKNQNAETYYKQALDLKQNYSMYKSKVDSLINLALLYKDTKQFEKSEDFFNKIISINSEYLSQDYPETTCSYFYIGMIKRQNGQNKKANKYFDIAKKLQNRSSLQNEILKTNLHSYCKVRMRGE